MRNQWVVLRQIDGLRAAANVLKWARGLLAVSFRDPLNAPQITASFTGKPEGDIEPPLSIDSDWSDKRDIWRPLGYEKVYLPLCKVADTPFHIQGGAILCEKTGHL